MTQFLRIAYCRADAPVARRLRDQLADALGHDWAMPDIPVFAGGVAFSSTLDDGVGPAVLLAVLGEGWFDAASASG